MALIVLAISIAILLALITWAKLNPLLALLVTAFCAGVLNGMSADAALKSILKGFGDTLGSLALMILFGAMLGSKKAERPTPLPARSSPPWDRSAFSGPC